jgi:colicin import membrane protein
MSAIVMSSKFQKSIKARARVMKKKIAASKKASIARRKFQNKQLKLQKALDGVEKRRLRREATAAAAAAKEQRKADRAAKKAAKASKPKRRRRSKFMINTEKLQKALAVDKKRRLRREATAATTAAKEQRKAERDAKKVSKRATKASGRKYAERRSKEEIQIDIMKKELERRVKFDTKWKNRFNLTRKATSLVKRAAKESLGMKK